MDPVSKSLWYIESHFAHECTLEDIAQAAGVSRFHLSRAFGAALGLSVGRYVRGRRLTEAARTLANGAPDILRVALDAGYGSHEAFTRAFRDQFGTTPEAVRSQHSLIGITVVEAIRRDHIMSITLDEPRIERGRLLLVAGVSERVSYANVATIPALWQRFGPHIGHTPGQVGDDAYGVLFNADDDSLEYMAAVEVASLDGLPNELRGLRIPEQRYAIFVHNGHISTIRNTVNAFWNEWLPQSQYEPIDAPSLERYGSDFDPRTGNGKVEIFVPIK